MSDTLTPEFAGLNATPRSKIPLFAESVAKYVLEERFFIILSATLKYFSPAGIPRSWLNSNSPEAAIAAAELSLSVFGMNGSSKSQNGTKYRDYAHFWPFLDHLIPKRNPAQGLIQTSDTAAPWSGCPQSRSAQAPGCAEISQPP